MPRILVADDAEMDRRVIRGVLAKEPELEVEAVGFAEDVLRTLRQGNWDLVITDLVMPGMGGLQLVGEVREKHPLVPVVVVTSRGSEYTAVQALKRGASSYVPKQLLGKLLLNTVQEVLAISQVRRVHDHLMDSVVEADTKFVLENELGLIDSLVVHLLEVMRTMKLCDAAGRRSAGVALKEALKNALYHGNLELDPAVQRSGGYRAEAAAEERKGQAPYRDRRIRVEANLGREAVAFTVADEGPGFDLGTLPDLDDPESVERAAGRGVVLMHTFMDQVRYNEAGNTVRLAKRCTTRPPHTEP